MSKVTALAAISFVIALFSFLAYDYAQGIMQDSVTDATGKIVSQSSIDETSKTSINSIFIGLGLLGSVGTILGVIAIAKKYFG